MADYDIDSALPQKFEKMHAGRKQTFVFRRSIEFNGMFAAPEFLGENEFYAQDAACAAAENLVFLKAEKANSQRTKKLPSFLPSFLPSRQAQKKFRFLR